MVMLIQNIKHAVSSFILPFLKLKPLIDQALGISNVSLIQHFLDSKPLSIVLRFSSLLIDC